jgi:hypothetical protein
MNDFHLEYLRLCQFERSRERVEGDGLDYYTFFFKLNSTHVLDTARTDITQCLQIF